MPDDIIKLRAHIIETTPSLNDPKTQSAWWLLGTTGCHLCDDAQKLMTRFQAVQPIIYYPIDIADFEEDLMMAFATTIPVLLTDTKRLNYPFSVMDLQLLLTH